MSDGYNEDRVSDVLDAVDYLINCGLLDLGDDAPCPWCMAALGGPMDDPEEHSTINGEPCPLGKLIDAYGGLR